MPRAVGGDASRQTWHKARNRSYLVKKQTDQQLLREKTCPRRVVTGNPDSRVPGRGQSRRRAPTAVPNRPSPFAPRWLLGLCLLGPSAGNGGSARSSRTSSSLWLRPVVVGSASADHTLRGPSPRRSLVRLLRPAVSSPTVVSPRISRPLPPPVSPSVLLRPGSRLVRRRQGETLPGEARPGIKDAGHLTRIPSPHSPERKKTLCTAGGGEAQGVSCRLPCPWRGWAAIRTGP